MTPTKRQIARRLRTLSNRMADVAADMALHAGESEIHGLELFGAAFIARQWADEIEIALSEPQEVAA